MLVANLESLRASLDETRKAFRETVGPINETLDNGIILFVMQLDLIAQLGASPQDDEIRVVEVLTTAFRRVIASYSLLEAGLPQEAHMILRNALELILIAIDITYNTRSMVEWKNTKGENPAAFGDWYFAHSRIVKRVKDDKEQIYPSFERQMVLGSEKLEGNGLSQEWVAISNISLHAHSYAQIVNLVNDSGHFQLLGRKTLENYAKDFAVLQVWIVNIVSVLHGIPKYRARFEQRAPSLPQAREFAKRYSTLIESSKAVREEISTKRDLAAWLEAKGFAHFDISGIPDDAAIKEFNVNLENPEDPVLNVFYEDPSAVEDQPK